MESKSKEPKYGYYGHTCYGKSEKKCHKCSDYNWVKINKEWNMQCTALHGCWKEDYFGIGEK